MRLGFKLVLAMLFVAAAPIGIAGFQAIGLSRTEVAERIRELLTKSAEAEAEIVGRDLQETERSLQLLASALELDPDSLSALSASLSRVYLLSDRFNAVALLDAEGRQVGPLIFIDDYESFSFEYQSHADMTPAEIEKFLAVARSAAGRPTGCASGRVYGSARKKAMLMVCAAPVTDARGRTLRLVVELSLKPLQQRFARFRVGAAGLALVVDADGALVFHPEIERALDRDELDAIAGLRRQIEPGAAVVGDYRDPGRGTMLGAFASVPGTGWTVAVAQPEAEAMAPAKRLASRLLAWLAGGLALAALLGWLLARRIVRPVRRLVDGALAIAAGDLEQRIPVRGRDEIGRLSESFNHMGSELAEQRRQIEAQTAEIQGWNVELQDRVEARTRELKQTQEQLLQAQKLAAVSELGAGVAHEINNPLMGVIGCAQLLLVRHPSGDPDHVLLSDIEREGRRIRDIVETLLDYAQTGGEQMARVDLANLVTHVVATRAEELAAAGVRVELAIPERFPIIMGDAEALGDCFDELLRNARHAMPEGGRIVIRGSGSEGKVIALAFEDSGVGIPPELHERVFEPFFTNKQNWDGKGLGLARVYQVVQRHMGRIELDSRPGRGATFTLYFPALRHSTHLR